MLDNRLQAVLAEYERVRDGIGGCTDGSCVIKRPVGMHTNGGCKCFQNPIKAQRMMRAAQVMGDALRKVQGIDGNA
jgi:hypothetical protein